MKEDIFYNNTTGTNNIPEVFIFIIKSVYNVSLGISKFHV